MSKHIVFIEISLTGAGEKAIDYAISKGYKVTLVSRNEDIKKFLNLDSINYCICETNNNEKLYIAIKNLNNKIKIDGITTTADLYVPKASYVAEKLGLLSISFDSAMGVRNKFIMRKRLEEHCPHLNPPFAPINTLDEALEKIDKWGYPVILKPQDANDSLYVKQINTQKELIEYIADSKKWLGQVYSDKILLEGYIDGEEYSVETIHYKGEKTKCIGVTGKVLIGEELGCFVEAGVFFPVDNEDSKIIFEEVSFALEKLNIDYGVIHTECRIKDGKVKILEINPRLMGDMAGSHMIEVALGTSPIEQVVEIALGNKIKWQPTKSKYSAMFGTLMPKTGIFDRIINLDEIKNTKGIKAVKVLANKGNKYYYPPRSNCDIVMRLVTEGNTPYQALELAKKVANSAKVKLIK